MEKLLKNRSRVYAIADFESCERNGIHIVDFARAFFEGGGENLQYRDKLSTRATLLANTKELKKVSVAYNGLLLVNDYAEIATELELPLHLGWDTPENAFQGPFGRSTHNPLEIERALAEKHMASYIGFGAVFASATKSEIEVNTKQFEFLFSKWTRDIVFIGGITEQNIHQLPAGKRYYYAIIQDFFSRGNQPVDIEKYTLMMNDKISTFT
ncbi:MAG: thiamine phosphate synthase [Leptospirales bacterium]